MFIFIFFVDFFGFVLCLVVIIGEYDFVRVFIIFKDCWEKEY